MLLFHGKRAPDGLLERWSEAHVKWLASIEWEYRALKASMMALVELFLYLDKQLKVMNLQLESLAQTEKYRERVGLLTQIPGMGMYSAMTILIELQDVERFQRADQLASYLGLTPSQRSSGESIRMGGITRCGNPRLRTRFVESGWTLICYDKTVREAYDRIKQQTGSGKKAIVAIARLSRDSFHSRRPRRDVVRFAGIFSRPPPLENPRRIHPSTGWQVACQRVCA